MLNSLENMVLPIEVQCLLRECKSVIVPANRESLLELAVGERGNKIFDVAYDVPGMGNVVEAEVVKCKNGIAVNYKELYMRRRDPDCMVISDNLPTDKETYEGRYGHSFDSVREETLEWLKERELVVMPFIAGGVPIGYEALLIVPLPASFFSSALADLHGFISCS